MVSAKERRSKKKSDKDTPSTPGSAKDAATTPTKSTPTKPTGAAESSGKKAPESPGKKKAESSAGKKNERSKNWTPQAKDSADKNKWRVGDWACGKCGAQNYKGRKDKCFRCQTPKASSQKAATSETAWDYLTKWSVCDDGWEADHVQQLWLTNNVYSKNMSGTCFDLFVPYLESLEQKHHKALMDGARLAANRSQQLIATLEQMAAKDGDEKEEGSKEKGEGGDKGKKESAKKRKAKDNKKDGEEDQQKKKAKKDSKKEKAEEKKEKTAKKGDKK